MSVDFIKNMEKAMTDLHQRGAFLTVKDGDQINTMTISWGNIGYMWRRPVFTVMVRKSRYTFEFLKDNTEFTVTVPTKEESKSALMICGSKSGRHTNKFNEASIKLKEGKSVKTPVIDIPANQYECKIVYKQEMNNEFLQSDIENTFYSDGDDHVFFFGEIVECYLDENNV